MLADICKMSKFATRCCSASPRRAGKPIASSTVRPDSLYERPIPERHRIHFLSGPSGSFRLEPSAAPPSECEDLRPGVRPSVRFRYRSCRRRAALGSTLRLARPAHNRTLSEPDSDRSGSWRWIEDELSDSGAAERRHRASPDARRDAGVHAASIAVRSKNRQNLKRRFRRAAPLQPAMIRNSRRRATLGISREDPRAFGWDNEFEATHRRCSRLRHRPLQSDQRPISEIRECRRISRAQPVEPGGLGLEDAGRNRSPLFWSRAGRRLAVPRHVRGDPTAARTGRST